MRLPGASDEGCQPTNGANLILSYKESSTTATSAIHVVCLFYTSSDVCAKAFAHVGKYSGDVDLGKEQDWADWTQSYGMKVELEYSLRRVSFGAAC